MTMAHFSTFCVFRDPHDRGAFVAVRNDNCCWSSISEWRYTARVDETVPMA